jgi:hypothetical protein
LLQRYIFPFKPTKDYIKKTRKGTKWNRALCLISNNFAHKSKKTAHNVATFEINTYLCHVVLQKATTSRRAIKL